MKNGFLKLAILFIISCSNNNKIKILVDSSQDLNYYIEAISSDFEYSNSEQSTQIIKFNSFKELYDYIKVANNTADLIITSSKNLNTLKEDNLIKIFENNHDFLKPINSKILNTVKSFDELKAVPFAISKKLIIYINTNLLKDVEILSLEDIKDLCFNYDTSCFDIYHDFKFSDLIYANTEDKEATVNYFKDMISRGKITGVLSFNDARARFIEAKVPLIFDYDSNFDLYNEKLGASLKIFKLPASSVDAIRSNNESVALSILNSSNKDKAILLNYIKYFIDEKNQNILINKFNTLAVLNQVLSFNNLDNNIKIISYRQFELSTLIEDREGINIYSILNDK